MQASLDFEIRDCLARYLAGEISLERFQEWFVPMAWDADQSGSWSAEELANEVELRLAEFSNGDRTEAELRELFRSTLETYTMAEAPEPVTSSSSELIAAGVTYQLSWAGTRS